MSAKTLVLCVILAVTAFGAVAQGQTGEQDQNQPQGEASTSGSDGQELPDFDKYFTPEVVKTMELEEARQNVQKLSTEAKEERGNALADFKRGAGMGITVAPQGDDRVDEAFIVDDQIVVTKENTNAARLMFEFHQLFTTNIFNGRGRADARRQLLDCEADPIKCPLFGIGPFIALQMSDDDAIASVGVGLMLGVRNDPRKDTSFNIGIGVQWDSNAKELAKGFVEGQPLPSDEDTIRFKEKGKARLMIGLSLGF